MDYSSDYTLQADNSGRVQSYLKVKATTYEELFIYTLRNCWQLNFTGSFQSS